MGEGTKITLRLCTAPLSFDTPVFAFGYVGHSGRSGFACLFDWDQVSVTL